MKLSLIFFILVSLTINFAFLNASAVFGEISEQQNIANKKLAEKYCDSLGKNLFKGLDKESTLKYEYFFSSIPENTIRDKKEFLETFKTNIKSICSCDISESSEKEFNSFLENYLRTRSITPKINVDAINPIPINPAIIPVFKNTLTVANSLPSFCGISFLFK